MKGVLNKYIECAKIALPKLVNPRILKHSYGVAEEAKKLAQHYHVDETQAYLAGLLHDCVKCFKKTELIAMAQKYRIDVDEITAQEPGLLHASVGANYVKYELNIPLDEVFYAILYHTTTDIRMDTLAKIIYMADYIEPNRASFRGLDQLRKLAYQNLDYSVLTGLNLALSSVLRSQKLIHPSSVEMRNFLIIN